MPSTAIIFIIDDDASVRRALGRVMASADFDCASFESGDEFLATADFKNQSGCIVADMAMLGMNGLELKNYLNQNQFGPPLIYLTAFDTREMRNAARAAGAVTFSRKPVDSQALLDAIDWALQSPSAMKPDSLTMI